MKPRRRTSRAGRYFARSFTAFALAAALLGSGCTALGYLAGEVIDRREVAAAIPADGWASVPVNAHIQLDLADGSRVRGRLLAITDSAAAAPGATGCLRLLVAPANRAGSLSESAAPARVQTVALVDVRSAARLELNPERPATSRLTHVGALMDIGFLVMMFVGIIELARYQGGHAL